ncbi:homeobox KN domain-containing protein [Pilobolus umbonatus]|nr:homeobox KN domain-containing protein [Pilobolus umbonatus]
MAHRVFKPIILFHDHSYCSDPSGVIHRIHIPYGDSHLIKKEKQKVESMLKVNGRVWSDYIQSTRSSPHLSPSSSSLSPKPTYYTSPQTPPQPHKQHKVIKGKTDKTDRHRTQLLLQQLGPDQHNNNNNKYIHEEEEEEEEDCYESDSSTSSSPTPNTIHQSHTIITNSTIKIKRRRGNLPKSVTAVLKQWLVEHCRNPYPTETEKTGLKNKTGLTLNQISNWFINARRRLLPQILDTVLIQQTDEPVDKNNNNSNNKKRKRSRIVNHADHFNPANARSSDTSMKRRRRYIKRI